MPPIMSVSQWTPEKSLPMGIKNIKTREIILTIFKKLYFLYKFLLIIIALPHTHKLNMVWDDG